MQCTIDPNALEIKTVNDFDKISRGIVFKFTCVNCNKIQYAKSKRKERTIKRYSTFLCENCFRIFKHINFYTHISTNLLKFKMLCDKIKQKYFKNSSNIEFRYVTNIPNVIDFKYIISEYGDIFTYDTNFNIIKMKFNNRNGYNIISLSSGMPGPKRLTHIFAHRLVCILWNGNPPRDICDPVVDHIDGNRINNHYTNLRWLSRGMNTSIALYRTGIGKNVAENIAKMIVSGKSDIEICEETGIKQSKIMNLRQGITYKDINQKYNLRNYVKKMVDKLTKDRIIEICCRLFILQQNKFVISKITNVSVSTINHIIYDNVHKLEKQLVMEQNFKADYIKQLENEILQAQNLYYNTDQVIMSDAEFDRKFDLLSRLDPNNPILHKVGEDSGSAFKKVKHKMHMFSQEKAINPDEFLDWARKQTHNEFVVEYKCDGSSIELQYENGIFKRAITRGNGEIGDDVTDNIIKASGVVKTLKDSSFTGGVRGEVLLMHDVFNKYFKDKANCRNAANGIMKRKNSEDADKLSIVVYDACNDDKAKNFVYEEEKLDWLKYQGFDVVYYESLVLDPKYIISLRDRLSTDRFNEIPYDIDGLVIKDNVVDLKDCERDRPTKQIAFKFILNEAQTTVRGIEFSVAGKTRTPVAICDPVYLCGTTVTRANLCNLGLIKENNLRIGSKVIMVKRGEIIPKIERVIETPPDCKEVEFPTFCEFCGSPLKVTDTTIYCPNLKCSETQKHRISTWAKINKIYGLGPQIVSLLYDNKIITKILDLYTSNASVESLSTAISPKIATKLVEQISKTKELSLAKYIAGFDLDGIGETTVINICQVIPQIYNLESLLSMSVDHLAKAPGFGYKAATNIVSELQTHKAELIELSNYVKIKPRKLPEISSNVEGVPHIFDCVVAFTGPLNTMSREDAVQIVRDRGGRVVSNVTPLVNYVVSNETESSNKKFVTAKKLGIKIINEEEFKRLLNGTF